MIYVPEMRLNSKIKNLVLLCEIITYGLRFSSECIICKYSLDLFYEFGDFTLNPKIAQPVALEVNPVLLWK